MASLASSSTALAPRSEDLEANHPQAEPSSARSDHGNGCCWFWSDLKHEWEANQRQMRHWIAFVVIIVLTLGLAVYY